MPNQNCSHGSLRNGKIQMSKLCIGREKCDLGKVEVKDKDGKLENVGSVNKATTKKSAGNLQGLWL